MEDLSKEKTKREANKTHYEIGNTVCKTIEDIGGTMPENLPMADSIKQIDKTEDVKLLRDKAEDNSDE